MRRALRTGTVVRESPTSRVIVTEGRIQPYALWVRLNDDWRIDRFFAREADALVDAAFHDGP